MLAARGHPRALHRGRARSIPWPEVNKPSGHCCGSMRSVAFSYVSMTPWRSASHRRVNQFLCRSWPTYRVGKRTSQNTHLFVRDLRERIANEPEISSDAWVAYPKAVEDALKRLGTDTIDLLQLHAFDAGTAIEVALETLDDLPEAHLAPPALPSDSHHKTQPSADAVLLMADSCVLGPNRHCHVPCRGWERDVVIYRQNNQFFCRADEPLSVDGVAADGNGEIQSGSHVEGEQFSFTWEKVV